MRRDCKLWFSIGYLAAFASTANIAAANDVDISDFAQAFTIRCSQIVDLKYLDQIEVVFDVEAPTRLEPTLSVDVFRTSLGRPDQRQNTGRSTYSWGEGIDRANVSIISSASNSGAYEIVIQVDNSNDGPLYQLDGSNKESYVSIGQWKFTNFDGLLILEEPILVQESISFYKQKVSNSVDRVWDKCTHLGSDGLYSTLETYLDGFQ